MDERSACGDNFVLTIQLTTGDADVQYRRKSCEHCERVNIVRTRCINTCCCYKSICLSYIVLLSSVRLLPNCLLLCFMWQLKERVLSLPQCSSHTRGFASWYILRRFNISNFKSGLPPSSSERVGESKITSKHTSHHRTIRQYSL